MRGSADVRCGCPHSPATQSAGPTYAAVQRVSQAVLSLKQSMRVAYSPPPIQKREGGVTREYAGRGNPSDIRLRGGGGGVECADPKAALFPVGLANSTSGHKSGMQFPPQPRELLKDPRKTKTAPQDLWVAYCSIVLLNPRPCRRWPPPLHWNAPPFPPPSPLPTEA
jgi:hypothetical protein